MFEPALIINKGCVNMFLNITVNKRLGIRTHFAGRMGLKYESKKNCKERLLCTSLLCT